MHACTVPSNEWISVQKLRASGCDVGCSCTTLEFDTVLLLWTLLIRTIEHNSRSSQIKNHLDIGADHSDYLKRADSPQHESRPTLRRFPTKLQRSQHFRQLSRHW